MGTGTGTGMGGGHSILERAVCTLGVEPYLGDRGLFTPLRLVGVESCLVLGGPWFYTDLCISSVLGSDPSLGLGERTLVFCRAMHPPGYWEVAPLWGWDTKIP